MKQLHQLPELEAYQDQPRQLPTGVPGKVAELEMGFERRGEKSILAHLYRRAPLIVHRAIYWDEQMPLMPCVFIISNAGGILQGDRNTISIALAKNTQAHVTTQSSTKIHEMDANFASQVQEIVLDEGAYLEYLPDPVIPFRHCRFVTQTRVSIAPTATLLYSEILMGGRKHHGELFEFDLFSSTLRGERPDGKELFTEKFIISPDRMNVRQAGLMGEFDVFSTVVLLTEPKHFEPIFDQVSSTVNRDEQWAAGISKLPNDAGLIYKVLTMDTQTAKLKIRELWALVREQITQTRMMKEFTWH